MASVDEGSEPLKYKTWVLKVSIHCEGCKKKVKKVLQSIEGVYKTTVDSQQHKVTVTGNVEAETLIKRLLKSGKPAELWPEKKPDSSNPTNGGGGGGGGGGKKNKNKNKNKDPSKPTLEQPESSEHSHTQSSNDESSTDASAKSDGEVAVTSGKNSSKPDKNESRSSSPLPEKQEGGEKAAAANGGGGKKKGKKGQNENNGGGGGGGGGGSGGRGEAGVVSDEVGSKLMVGGGGGGGGVSIPAYNFPVYSTPPPPPPAYVMSYRAVQPSMSYGAAYYPLPMQQSSSFYSVPPPVAATPASDYIFSDENANACSLM